MHLSIHLQDRTGIGADYIIIEQHLLPIKVIQILNLLFNKLLGGILQMHIHHNQGTHQQFL